MDKTILFLIEDHETKSQVGQLIATLDKFEPEAIVIEFSLQESATRIAKKLRSGGFNMSRLSSEKNLIPSQLALRYAYARGLPLYFSDWNPTSPQEVAIDIIKQDPPSFRVEDFIYYFLSTWNHFFPDISIEKIIPPLSWAVQSGNLTGREDLADLMMANDYSGAIRNEYQAQVNDFIPQSRLAQFGGGYHFFPPNPKITTPLHWIIQAERIFLCDTRIARSPSDDQGKPLSFESYEDNQRPDWFDQTTPLRFPWKEEFERYKELES
jgi:hypothetical protein